MILRVKGVKRVRAKGRIYYYHRKTLARLPGVPGSPEFMAKLNQLNSPTASVGVGSLGGLIAAYRASADWMNLAPGSRREYNKHLERLRTFARFPLAVLDRDFVYDLRDTLSAHASRGAANGVIKVLRLLYVWGSKRQAWRHYCADSPAALVEKIRRPKDAKLVNRRWHDDELVAVLEEAPPWMRVPIAIAAYTGMRVSDCVRVTWTSYNGTEFEARQFKTGAPIWVKAHYRLRGILDAAPRISPQMVVGVRGRPMTANSLGSRFFEFVAELRKAGKIGNGLSFHGLRHTCGTRLAEAGCDALTIGAVLGHSSAKQTEQYVRTAKRHHLANAAIDLIEELDREHDQAVLERERLRLVSDRIVNHKRKTSWKTGL